MTDLAPVRATPQTIRQTEDAYRRLAAEARYRPAAPSDSMGTIVVPLAELDLAAEARSYTLNWLREENDLTYFAGCPDFPDRPALIFIIEAARALCGCERELASRLLRMAADELGPGPA